MSNIYLTRYRSFRHRYFCNDKRFLQIIRLLYPFYDEQKLYKNIEKYIKIYTSGLNNLFD